MLAQVIQTLPQVIIDGLTLGAVYAVIAIGYTLVYGILELINFAHGEIFMSGAFIGTAILFFLFKFRLFVFDAGHSGFYYYYRRGKHRDRILGNGMV
ncbi:hypothetical protein QS257_12730 [Terrilactibacillus sp. S3-3]|nr:hypothetical protein QS257_12730 [Terrilactibacillus sp. S3-3]